MASGTREKILATAERLIYEKGINATSMEALVHTSGVARKSIYRHFINKDDVAVAALAAHDKRWMSWFRHETEHVDDPITRVLHMFDVLADWCASSEFKGCAFINTACEVGDADAAVCLVSKAHKKKLLDYVLTTCKQLDCAQPDVLARQLLILMDGAITVAKVTGEIDAAQNAQAVARVLLASIHSFVAN